MFALPLTCYDGSRLSYQRPFRGGTSLSHKWPLQFGIFFCLIIDSSIAKHTFSFHWPFFCRTKDCSVRDFICLAIDRFKTVHLCSTIDPSVADSLCHTIDRSVA